MSLSIVCIIVDILSVTPVISIGVINPFWKFAFVFKCFTDSIILDDFKAALDKLSHRRQSQLLPVTSLGVYGPEAQKKYGTLKRYSTAHADTFPVRVELSDVGSLCMPSPVQAREGSDVMHKQG